MIEKNQLTQGSILQALIGLALPIMGTAFVQTAYNLTDMLWIGRLGSNAVAAVGTAGFFTWFAQAFILISKIGAEIGVAQSIGREDPRGVSKYIQHSILLNLLLAMIYGSFLIILRRQIIGFFNLGNENVVEMAETYLLIISLGVIFQFVNPVFTAILNGHGQSRIPFLINVLGLASNMVLDPIFIFGFGPFPALGVTGAAIATNFAQLIVTLFFIYTLSHHFKILSKVHFSNKLELGYLRHITKLGLPVALQSGFFSVIAMVIARIIAQWGPIPVAVQKVGSQIEAISYMTAHGFSTALGAFVGQNFGANKWRRIYKGYLTSMVIMSVVGVFATLLLVLGARPIFMLFIQEEIAIIMGIQYLKIIGISQLFQCYEITTEGAFNGIGKTIPPAFVGILFNALRIPSALALSKIMGLDGIWWSISISSIFKGFILVFWFGMVLKQQSYRIRLREHL